MDEYSDIQKQFLALWDEATKEFFTNPTKETSNACGTELRATVIPFSANLVKTLTEREVYDFYFKPIEFRKALEKRCFKLSQMRLDLE